MLVALINWISQIMYQKHLCTWHTAIDPVFSLVLFVDWSGLEA